MYSYDYLVVGSGLFGAVFAHEAHKKGKKVLVIDKRSHKGGNVYCELVEGINVHKYGEHIFHTDDKSVWDYANKLVEFNNFINSPIVNFEDKLYNLPINMNTFYQLWEVKTPREAKEKLELERKNYINTNPENLEEKALNLYGKKIYESFIKDYARKKWACSPSLIPIDNFVELPIRYTFNNNYYTEKYQGIPVGGYNKLIDSLLEGIECMTNTNYLEYRDHFDQISEKIIYTGKLDEFFKKEHGVLEYRSLHFERDIIESDDFQGNAIVYYTDMSVDYNKIVEHKHFEFGEQKKTVISVEYPCEYDEKNEPYYPINNDKNKTAREKYLKLAEECSDKYIFGGRLANYKYFRMDETIKNALELASSELS